jgi:hypothetical protein
MARMFAKRRPSQRIPHRQAASLLLRGGLRNRVQSRRGGGADGKASPWRMPYEEGPVSPSPSGHWQSCHACHACYPPTLKIGSQRSDHICTVTHKGISAAVCRDCPTNLAFNNSAILDVEFHPAQTSFYCRLARLTGDTIVENGNTAVQRSTVEMTGVQTSLPKNSRGSHAMCPICVTTTVLMTASATSGIGAVGLIAACRRALHRWLLRQGLNPIKRSVK